MKLTRRQSIALVWEEYKSNTAPFFGTCLLVFAFLGAIFGNDDIRKCVLLVAMLAVLFEFGYFGYLLFKKATK